MAWLGLTLWLWGALLAGASLPVVDTFLHVQIAPHILGPRNPATVGVWRRSPYVRETSRSWQPRPYGGVGLPAHRPELVSRLGYKAPRSVQRRLDHS